jgi:hypothetical protein
LCVNFQPLGNQTQDCLEIRQVFFPNAGQNLKCSLLFRLFDFFSSTGEPFPVEVLAQASRFYAYLMGDLAGLHPG